jgi:hypothetical protein
MALLAGGASVQLQKDVGTSNPVAGQQVFGTALHGVNLLTGLPVNIITQVGDGSAQLSQVILISKINIGNNVINRLYLGAVEINKMYIGNTTIWQN